MPTDIKLKGELDFLRVKQPVQATMLNMSSAAKANLAFFGLNDLQGRDIWVSIAEVAWLRDVPEQQEDDE